MAGHVRTVDTGRARRTASGRTRRVREHLPPGEVEAARRCKQHLGARTAAANKINRANDLLKRLDIAREYLRSAAAKYEIDTAAVEAAVEALLAAGDRTYQHGAPLTASAKRRRREEALKHRAKRQQTAVLVREGLKAVRSQQAEARRVS